MIIVVMQIVPLAGADDSQYRFQHVFMNPSPAIPPDYDAFGFGLATLGDYILVGSGYDGPSTTYPEEVYLFDGVTGVLLRTFYNPTPNEHRRFGSSVAADGDMVFVGSPTDDTHAEYAGAVHVFDANTGALLRTIYSPTPNEGDQFGGSIAAKGNMVLVGSRYDDSAGVDAGAVYLFDAQTGSLVQTFLNPVPYEDERFGYSLTFVSDDVLIGETWAVTDGDHRGEVHLFDASTGDLLKTFLNPDENSDAPDFGESMASNGSAILIGSTLDYTGGVRAGAAYLYDAATGGLLQTFLNPTPDDDWFGNSVAFYGDDVLIGAPLDDTAGADSGAAYLFDSQTGSLLFTFLHPYPSSDERLGFKVVSTSGRVYLSAIMDHTAESNAGAVLMFEEPTPFESELLIWVASHPYNLKRYDGHTGEYIDDFVSDEEAGKPCDFTFGPDGYLYVSFPDTDEVKRFNKYTGDLVDTFVSSGSGGLERPNGLRFGPDQNLYVCSSGSNQIKRYNGETGDFMDDFAEDAGMISPSWIFWWGDLYVSSFYSDEVKRFDGDTGEFIENFVTAGSGGLHGPMGLIFQGDGYLYVVSSRTNEVKRYDEDDGEFVDTFVTAGAGGLRYPVDLQFADDHLFVTSFWTHDVKRFDGETGEYVDDFVTAGRGGLNRPLGIRILIALSPPTDGDGTEPPGWGRFIQYLVAIVLLVSTVVWVGYIRKR